MSSNIELQSGLWKILMINKIIVSKYIEEKDENGFYNEMMVDRNTANLLKTEKIHDLLFMDVTHTLNQLDCFSKLGYVEKRNSEINLIIYDYTLYYLYPLLLPMGYFDLPGNVYSISESILIATEKYNELEKKLYEFKNNVLSGIYTNILDFNFMVKKKFKSIVYEVTDKYFDSINFFKIGSVSKFYSTMPLNIPNKEQKDEKRWKGEEELGTATFTDKNKVDAAIDNLEWKRDKIGLLIIDSRAYWLMRNGRIINYHDKLTREIFGIPDYLEPGFSSLENYLSRIFEDSVAQFLQSKYGYFTQVRAKPSYLDGQEIDVFANKLMPKTFTVCECKFRLRN